MYILYMYSNYSPPPLCKYRMNELPVIGYLCCGKDCGVVTTAEGIQKSKSFFSPKNNQDVLSRATAINRDKFKVWLATTQTNKQARNESSRGVSQQVRLGTILRVGKTRKPRKTKGDG